MKFKCNGCEGAFYVSEMSVISLQQYFSVKFNIPSSLDDRMEFSLRTDSTNKLCLPAFSKKK